MFKAWNATWERLPFLGRLLVTASLALLIAGSTMLLVSARQEARDSQADLAADMANRLETLPSSLAEVVVIGDFSTLQQTLNIIASRANVLRVEYRDQTGASLRSEHTMLTTQAPTWFANALEFHDISGHAKVTVGGRDYGELHLTLSARQQANRAWMRLLHHLAILLLAVTLDFLGIWLVLRNGLAPLNTLEQGANALAQGHLETRLKIAGSPELRNLIAAFNRMADATQSAQENLARSNAELQRFAEIAAHHLQEPARRLSSYAQLLRGQLADRNLDAETQTSLDFIQQQARRQQALVRDVQRYLAAGQALVPATGIENQVKNKAEQAMQCDAVLRQVLTDLTAQIEKTSAQIEVAPLPSIKLDSARLSELFSALLDNALRHGQPGRAMQISVRCGAQNDMAHCQIADNGPGIAAEYRERVFRVFERLSSAGEGTGVGLAIVRRMVESAGGRVWLEETPGGGCTVNFTLPIDTAFGELN
jgi:signal transduction histidine kinase